MKEKLKLATIIPNNPLCKLGYKKFENIYFKEVEDNIIVIEIYNSIYDSYVLINDKVSKLFLGGDVEKAVLEIKVFLSRLKNYIMNI